MLDILEYKLVVSVASVENITYECDWREFFSFSISLL
jgi:hypothetical protein